MAAASGLRIGDAEREAAAVALREHFAQGRLTLEEFQQRLAAVFAAKTDRDLAEIHADLPHVAGPSPARPAVQATNDGKGGYRRRPAGLAVVAGFIMIILALVLVAFILPVALFATAISRSLLFILAILLFGRRGLLRKFRRWLPQKSRRRPF
jgi:uncharacterized membrane protein